MLVNLIKLACKLEEQNFDELALSFSIAIVFIPAIVRNRKTFYEKFIPYQTVLHVVKKAGPFLFSNTKAFADKTGQLFDGPL